MTLKSSILIFVVSYNAGKFIQSVLTRIPDKVWENDQYHTEVLIIDDQSLDETYYRAVDYQREHPNRNLTILSNPVNQGYGGNQKLGYHYALKYGFELVVLLHGDGQYAPEILPEMIKPIIDGEADIVFGSRMIKRYDALRGGMPLYKWVGNQVLTGLQNFILRSNLTEFHTGYRAYSTKTLSQIPFRNNSNYFDFDTDIIIQCIDNEQHIMEVPIPTYYGDEISHVNGIQYGLLILRTTFISRLMKYGIFYDPKFDYASDGTQYTPKLNFPSSHKFAIDRVQQGTSVLDIGCGPGYMAETLSAKEIDLVSLDRHIHPKTSEFSRKTIEANADEFDFTTLNETVDTILLLDIIEHLREPETFLNHMRDAFAESNPRIIITTANIGFFIVRFSLLFGQFNYSKRGILDLDHTRLFTFGSLKRVLRNSGYEIIEVQGIPAPYPLAFGENIFSRILVLINQFLIWMFKGMFSYQMAFVVRPLPTIELLLNRTMTSSEEKLQVYDGDA